MLFFITKRLGLHAKALVCQVCVVLKNLGVHFNNLLKRVTNRIVY